MRTLGTAFAVFFLSFSAFAHTDESNGFDQYVADIEHENEGFADDAGLGEGIVLEPWGCTMATASQKSVVDDGNSKAARFLQGCYRATGSSPWCLQLMRPNPSSRNTFSCTYGSSQPHQLIHPNEATWKNAYKAVQLVRDLEALGVRVAEIYNWWRPEPYNKNVGGAARRHPFGTSVDVRLASLAEMRKAHKLLCQFRQQGRLRALGYYGSTGLHLGVGDMRANTWGKSCQ